MKDPLTHSSGERINSVRRTNNTLKMLIVFNVLAIVSVIVLVCFISIGYYENRQAIDLNTKEPQNLEANLEALPNKTDCTEEAFNAFVIKYGKLYGDENETNMRYEIFAENYHKIVAFNSNPDRTSDMGVNQFSDLTQEEFSKNYLGLKSSSKKRVNGRPFRLYSSNELPESLNWTEKGVVTPVKNQGRCGSCWAFSTTGAIESAVAIKTGNLTSLSEQELLDCSNNYTNKGCAGGEFQYAFEYVREHGLTSEDAYNYSAASTFECKRNDKKNQVTLKWYNQVAWGDNEKLLLALNQQPISIGVQAVSDVFRHYTGGIISDEACGTFLDHAILLTGYGVDCETGYPYWIVKNSWGTGWGENGYARILRHNETNPGICGIAQDACYPVVA